MAAATIHSAPAPSGHETTDVNVTSVFLAGVAFVVAIAVVFLIVWLVFVFLSGRAARQDVSAHPLAGVAANRLPPEPRLQTNPRQDLQDLNTAANATLQSYGWVDRNAGIVHIPIEEAMRLTIARGLPTRPAPEAQKP